MANLVKSFAEWLADLTGLRDYARQQNAQYEQVVSAFLAQNGKSNDLNDIYKHSLASLFETYSVATDPHYTFGHAGALREPKRTGL